MAIELHNNIKDLDPNVYIVFPGSPEEISCKRITVGQFSRYEPYILDIRAAQAKALGVARDCLLMEKERAESKELPSIEEQTERALKLNDRKKDSIKFLCDTLDFLLKNIIKPSCVPETHHEILDTLPPEMLVLLFETLLYGEEQDHPATVKTVTKPKKKWKIK